MRDSAPVGIGTAIRELRLDRGLRQEDLGNQSLVSHWETGRNPPTFAEIADLERKLRVPKGALYIRAGYVKATTVEAAILADPELEPGERINLLDFYQVLVARSKERRKRR